ncbi:hypothetical protein GGI07_000178 [Coemansia sp. Benny D115]|nr:hypothetical protein GGI07_000178 [Coemansia sp. Benny D115]
MAQATVAVFQTQVIGQNHTFGTRALAYSDVRKVMGGVLFKNGKQTTCEVGLISSKAGYIAASCFDFSGSSINRSTKYEVYIDDGSGSSNPSIYTINPLDITIHPNYNPNTYENNISVVQFNKQAQSTYTGYIVTNVFSIAKSSYVRRTYDTKNKKWNLPIYTGMVPNSNECVERSGLMAKNSGNMACVSIGTMSIYQSSCTVPYGTLYAAGNNMVALAGIYSYSVVEKDSMCRGGSRWYNYYTLLWNLDRFATSVLGYPVDVMSSYEPSTEPSIQLYINAAPSNADMNGWSAVSGNLYPLQGANQDDPVAPVAPPVVVAPAPQTTKAQEPQATSSPSNNNNSGGTNNSNSNNNNNNDDSNANGSGSGGDDKTNNSDDNDSGKGNSTKDTNDNAGGDDEEMEAGDDEDKGSGGKSSKSSKGGSNGKTTAEEEENLLDEDIMIAPDVDSSELEALGITADVINEEEFYNKFQSQERNNEGGGAATGAANGASPTNSAQQANNESNGSKLDRTQIIIISVIVPVVGLLLAIVILLLYRAYKNKKDKEKWDPLAEANHHRNAIFELGGVDDSATPPPYMRDDTGSSASLNISKASIDSTRKDVKL